MLRNGRVTESWWVSSPSPSSDSSRLAFPHRENTRVRPDGQVKLTGEERRAGMSLCRVPFAPNPEDLSGNWQVEIPNTCCHCTDLLPTGFPICPCQGVHTQNRSLCTMMELNTDVCWESKSSLVPSAPLLLLRRQDIQVGHQMENRKLHGAPVSLPPNVLFFMGSFRTWDDPWWNPKIIYHFDNTAVKSPSPGLPGGGSLNWRAFL